MTEITRDTKLTTELLTELKNEYKKLYQTVLEDGTQLIWRRLNRAEYKQMMQDSEDMERVERLWTREEECCRLAIVYPCKEMVEEILAENAGVATVLSDEIYAHSGFKFDVKTAEI